MADVQPILVNGETHHQLVRINEPLNHIGHIKRLAARHVLKHGWLQKVDPRVDEKAYLRFFANAEYSLAIAFNHAIWNLHFVMLDGDGHLRAVLVVVGEHLTYNELRYDIPVHNQHGPVRPLHESEGAAGAERVLLMDVFDINVERVAISKMIANRVWQVVSRDCDILDTGALELLNKELQYRFASDLQHRLRD